MSLPAGAALVVPPPGPLLGEQLAEVLADARVTHALIPPAALATVPSAAADNGLPHFRTLIVGGEACPAELVDRWAPGRRMINSYGPTESTVVATWTEPLSPAGSSADRPADLPNTRVYVLDAALRPVPIGCGGRVVRRRARPGPRLPGPAGPDRAAVRGRPVRQPGRPDVPHRRPGPLERRRPAGVPRPGRRPGQDPRIPDRARARSRRRCAGTPRRPTPWSSLERTSPADKRLVGYRGRAGSGRMPTRSELRALRQPGRCPSTWCPRRSWSWTTCR